MRQVYYVAGTILAFMIAGVFFFQPENTELDKPVPLPDVNLITKDERRVDSKDFLGHWSLVYLGYTHCPDICPASLGQMKAIKATLKTGPHIKNLRFVLVSVDPKRDSPERLRKYLDFFDKEFEGYTGEKPDLDMLVAGLGQTYGFEDSQKKDYEVFHPSAFFLINPKGQWVRRFDEMDDIEGISKGITETVLRPRHKTEM